MQVQMPFERAKESLEAHARLCHTLPRSSMVTMFEEPALRERSLTGTGSERLPG